MVRISAGIPLLTVTDGTEILGVVKKDEGDTFLFTSDRLITVFKPQDHKPLQSWVNKPTSRFTCPAVYIPNTEEFVAVVNDKQIYKWSSQNATPFKQKPKTLKTGVSRMFMVSGGNPFLLMTNGSVMPLDDALAGRRDAGKGCLREDERIRDAWLWIQGDDNEDSASYVVCLVENAQTKRNIVLLLPVHHGPKQHEQMIDDELRLQLDDPTNVEGPLESVAFFCNETTAVLHSLWGGGHLCSSSITLSDLRRQKDAPYLACHHRCTLHGNTGKVKIAAIDDRHVAVAGFQSKTAKDKVEASLCIWETAYGTMQSYLRLSLEDDDDDDGTPSFLDEVNGHLILATQRMVMLHRYECSDGTLAAALGRLANEEQDQDLPVLGLDWTSSVAQESPAKKPRGRRSTALPKTQTKSKQSDEQTSSLLNSILDESKNQTSKSFSSSVEKFLKGYEDRQPDSTALVLILRNVIKRTEANSKFWCPDALHNIIATKAVAASSCPEFVAMLARRQEVSLLLDCLQYMRDIPELTLVQCLQVFLSIDEDKLPSSRHATETDEESATEHEVISPARRTYVDEVLSKPFTDSFLLDAVKHLQFQEVTLLLRYLHYLLTTSFPAMDDSTPEAVSMDSVVDWIGTLLDAHFAQLVLIPEVRPLLTQLKDAVKDQVQFSAELNIVRNLLHHTQSARSRIKTRQSQAVKSYTIEVLKI